MRRLAAVCALLLATLACEPPPDEEPLACRNEVPGEVELGVGDLSTGFAPLGDGEEIPIVLGPQGMHMITVSVAVTNLEPPTAGGLGTEVRIAMRYHGQVVGGTVNALAPTTVIGEVSEFVGLRPIITEAEVEELAGETLTVEATVRDGCGRELYTERDWVFVQ